MAARAHTTSHEASTWASSHPAARLPNFASRFRALPTKHQGELLPQFFAKLKISGEPSVTALFDCVMKGGQREKEVNKLLDAFIKQVNPKMRPRAKSEAHVGHLRLSDQEQLGLSVEAICANLQHEPYILQWLERYFASCTRFKPKPNSPIAERIDAVREVFRRRGSGDLWDGVLVDQVKAQIAISSASATMQDSAQKLCTVDKCLRLTPVEALLIAITSSVTPNFSSHGLAAHRLLLELICHQMHALPAKAKTLESIALSVAFHLAERYVLEPDETFASFHFPTYGSEEAKVLAQAGFYTHCKTFDHLPEPLPGPVGLKNYDALSLDFSTGFTGFAATMQGEKAHREFAKHLSTVSSASKIVFKGHESQLIHYAPLLAQAQTLWLDLTEMSESGLKSLEDLANCHQLVIRVEGAATQEYKRLAKIITGAPKLQMLVIDGVCFSLSSFRSKDAWNRHLKVLKVAISLKGEVQKGCASFCLSLLQIPTLHLTIDYPSTQRDIIPAPPDIETGTKTAAVRQAQFDTQVMIQSEEYKRARESEKAGLHLLLHSLGYHETLKIHIHEWPEEFDALLPTCAKSVSVVCDRLIPHEPKPIQWKLQHLSWQSSAPRPSGDWLGTTNSFSLEVQELAFVHSNLSVADLEGLVNELCSCSETVRSLDLRDNSLSLEALPLLSTLLQQVRLLRLNLEGNPLTESGVENKKSDTQHLPPPLPRRSKAKPSPIYSAVGEEGCEDDELQQQYIPAAELKRREESLYGFDLPGAVEDGASQEESEEIYEPFTGAEPEPKLYQTTDEALDGRNIHAPQGLFKHMQFQNSAVTRCEEEVSASSPPSPPPRSGASNKEPTYLSTGDVQLAQFLRRVSEIEHLIALNIAGCGWSDEFLKVLPKLQNILELGIGTERCSEADVNAILSALEETSVRFVTIPVKGTLQEKVAAWNLRRALEDPRLAQSEA